MIRIGVCILALVLLSSCEQPNTVISFQDSFDSKSSGWITVQMADSTRHIIVQDPLDSGNNCLKLSQFPTDHFAGAKRSEYVFRPDVAPGRTVNYSFKFMFPKSFFKPRDQNDWIIIQQWHDEPPKDTLWQDYKENTKPPMALLIGLKPSGQHTIEFKYGLKSNQFNQDQTVMYSGTLQPDTWYTFANTIAWSMENESGYAIPKINGEYLVPKSKQEEHKVLGRNMYNNVPNYYKTGLYGNKKSNDTIFFYLDEFSYKTFPDSSTP